MRAVKLKSLKNLRLAFNVTLKTVIASSIVLIVAAIVLFSPWYSVTLSTQIPQTNTYTKESVALTSNLGSSYATQTSLIQAQTVYSLQAPVSLAGECGSACWVSPSFSLKSGSIIQVSVSECQLCVAFIDSTNGSSTGITLGMFMPSTGTFRIPDSGNYVVTLGNTGNFDGTVTSISVSVIIESTNLVTQPTELVETATIALGTIVNTVTYTQYSQAIVSPYTILGGIVSAMILALLAVVLGASVLVDRGIIAVSTKHHRKRRKR
jgi:hypothetical protein